MNEFKWLWLFFVLLNGILVGCAQLVPDPGHWKEQSEQVSAIDKHSSFPAVRRPMFEQINLIELVDPDREAENKFALSWKLALDRLSTNPESSVGLRYDLALAAFRERSDSALRSKQAHRDAVQDRILGVATSRCNVFKTYLRRQQADTNFLLGSLTTASGVLGAVLQGAKASRNLAGAAGLFSGLQAEYNSSYYSNLAAHVIVQGIETHQARLLTQIVEARRSRDVHEYGMEAAIKDAVHFDGTCSTVVGLLEAAEAIKEVVNPGIPRAAELIAAVKAMNTISQTTDIQSLMQSGELQKLLLQAAPKASPLVVRATQETSESAKTKRKAETAMAVEQRLQAYVEEQAQGLASTFRASQSRLPEGIARSDANVGAKAKTKFADDVQKALGKDPFKLSECVALTQASYSSLSAAMTTQALAGQNSSQEIKAKLAVDKAAAEVNAASARLERLFEKARAYVRSQALAWGGELSKPEPDRSETGLKVTTPPENVSSDAAGCS